MKNYKEINIKITIKAGSDFQLECMLKSLTSYIKAWGEFYSYTHKRNKITVEGIEDVIQL